METLDEGNEEHWYVLLPHSENESLLVLKERKLPYLSIPDEVSEGEVHKTCSFVQNHFHLPFRLTLLRKECECKLKQWWTRKILVFENQTLNPQAPKGWKWVQKDRVTQIIVSPSCPPVSSYLLKYAVEGLRVNEAQLLPYSQAGWFTAATTWVIQRLDMMGHKVKSVMQVKHGTPGYILRVEVESSLFFYMKAIPPNGFNDELRTVSALAEVLPSSGFVTSIAENRTKSLMLMQDCGKPVLKNFMMISGKDDLAQSVLSKWGEVQLRSIDSVKDLEDLGCFKMDGSALVGIVKKIMNSPDWFRCQQARMKDGSRVERSESDYKAMYLTFVQKLCTKISTYNIPLALVHGDLNPLNTLLEQDDGAYRFLDFSDTCVSFPFLDAISIASFYNLEASDLGFYYNLWRDFEPLERAQELLKLIEGVFDILMTLRTWRSYENAEESCRCSARKEVEMMTVDSYFEQFD